MRKFWLIGVALTAILVAACGSSGAISVDTSSMSEAEFVKRADGTCGTLRTEFERQFAGFDKNHSVKQSGSEDKWAEEVVNDVVVPTYGEEWIDKLSAIGAPSAEKEEFVAFLEELDQRVGQLQEDPHELVKSPYPFARVAKLAKKAGLKGCAGTFS